MDSLRIVTINTGKCDGPYRQRIAWLTQELERLEPDIVACQEVFRSDSGTLDTAAVIAGRLGMQVVWSPARFKQRRCEGLSVFGWSGMAMLTRIPYTDFATVTLPTDERDGDRVAQVCVVPCGESQIVIANVHLSYLRDVDELRWEQLQTVLGHPLFDQPDARRLVCGDFNSTIEGPVLTRLLASRDIDVRDAFLLGDGRGPRSTLPPRPDSQGRDACIDFILSVAPSSGRQPIFRSSTVVLNRPESGTGILPSDHYGIATTLLALECTQAIFKNGRIGD
jgi:endonuclease/exonuclease/phosphatase family metal-dependent hydrolase